MTISLSPIAYVHNTREDLRDDGWGKVESRIELCPEFADEVFDGLDDFSHIEVVFQFHRVTEESVERGTRHPRGNTAWPKVGIFSQRGKHRPNRLGVSFARLIRRDVRRLIVQGLDAIDGSPVLDLKPVLFEFLPVGEILQPAWSREVMARYWT